MARHNGHKAFKTRRNKGQHQRRRSTRGGRLISKLIKGGDTMNMPHRLGTVTIGSEEYFVDRCLK